MKDRRRLMAAFMYTSRCTVCYVLLHPCGYYWADLFLDSTRQLSFGGYYFGLLNSITFRATKVNLNLGERYQGFCK